MYVLGRTVEANGLELHTTHTYKKKKKKCDKDSVANRYAIFFKQSIKHTYNLNYISKKCDKVLVAVRLCQALFRLIHLT